MKKAIAIMLAGIMSMSMAIPCLAEETNTEISGELRVAGVGFGAPDDVTDPLSGVTKIGYNTLIEKFQEAYPNVTVTIDTYGWTDWQSKLSSLVLGEQVDVLVHGGSLVDLVDELSPYIEADPTILDEMMVKGVYRRSDETNYDKLSCTAIPVGLNPYVICYDKQIFDDYGVEYPSSEDTWDDLLAKLKAITGTDPVTGETTYGSTIVMTGTNSWRPFASYNASKGINVTEFNASKWESTVDFTSEEVVGSLAFLQELATTFAPGYLEQTGHELFGTDQNNIGVLFDTSILSAYNTSVGSDCVDRYGYCAYPQRYDGNGSSGFLGDWNMAIPNNSANKDAAWAFIRWMATSDDVTEYLLTNDWIPNGYAAVEGMISDNLPYATALQDAFAYYPENYWCASSEHYDNSFGSMESIFMSNVMSLYSGDVTPEECAANIQAEVDEQIELNK